MFYVPISQDMLMLRLNLLPYVQICIEGPTGIKLRDCADKVIGLKQEMTVMKQNMKSQANTQDSLRAAVSHLDKQVQVLPSTLAKQLAHPPEQHDILPKGDSEAAHQQQQQQAQQAQVAETQLTSWSQALEQQQDTEATLAARAAFLHQQQQVPLSRQLMQDASQQPAVVTAAAAAAVGSSPRQQQQQQQQEQEPPQTLPAVTASAAGAAAPQATVVQVMLLPIVLRDHPLISTLAQCLVHRAFACCLRLVAQHAPVSTTTAGATRCSCRMYSTI